MSSTNVIGSAYVTILPDTTKTTTQTVAGLSAAGNAGGKALASGVQAGAEKGSSAASAAFSKFGSSAATALGPAFAPIGELQEKFEGLAESIKKEGPLSAAGLAGMGTAALGAGVALQAMASKDESSMAQLKAAIGAAGQDADDFTDKIKEAQEQNEKYGFSESQTNTALQNLTTITGDANRATDLMNVTTNLAAARHISLSAAATQVGKAAEGNTKLFKMYGITVGENSDGTKDYQGAMDQLSAKLDGQAAASVDSFTGRLKVLGTQVEDNVAKFGEKWGPTIVATGAALELLGGLASLGGKAIDLMRGSTEAATEATQADAAASQLSATATQTEAAAAGKAEAADSLLAGAEGRAALAAGEQAVATEGAAAANAELAASSDAAAGGGLLKMAASAGIAGVAIIGIGLVVNHFMQESKKQAAENKAAWDAYWASITANRSQGNLKDLQAEAVDLTKSIDEQKAAFIATGGANNEFGKKMLQNFSTTSTYAKQLDQINSKIKAQQVVMQAMGTEFHMTTDQVQALADANNIDLSGSLETVEAAFQKVEGGAGAVIDQTAALAKQYDTTTQGITDFATAQKITLDGTAAQTTAFRNAVTATQEVGSETSTLATDYGNLTSQLSSTTDKASAFKDILDTLIGQQISAAQAADDFQQKINDLGGALSKNSHTIDGQSDSAINNRKAIEDLITAATTATDQTYKQTGSVGQANAQYEVYYQNILDSAKANGISTQSLQDLLSSLGALPSQVAAGLGATVAVGADAGYNTINAFAGATTSGASESMIQNAMSAAAAAASKAMPDFSLIGDTAADSLITGYVAGITKNLSRATEASEQVPAAARYALDSHSPSKVMMAIGADAGIGLALGLEGATPVIQAAASKMVGGIGGAAAAIAKTMTGVKINPNKAAMAPAPGSVMPAGGGVQVNGYWMTQAQLAAAGGIDAAIAAHPATGGVAAAGASAGAGLSPNLGPQPVAIQSGGLTPSDLVSGLAPLLKALNEMVDKMTLEIAATNGVTAMVKSTAGSGLSQLYVELNAGKKK